MKEALIKRFDDDKIEMVIRSRINKRSLKSNETVSEIFNELRKEANKVQMDEEAFLFQFLNQMPKSYMQQTIVQNQANVEDALAIAKTHIGQHI